MKRIVSLLTTTLPLKCNSMVPDTLWVLRGKPKFTDQIQKSYDINIIMALEEKSKRKEIELSEDTLFSLG